MRRLKTISEFHQFRQLPAPEHPLISVVEIDRVLQTQGTESMTWCYDFYAIGLKRVSFYTISISDTASSLMILMKAFCLLWRLTR